MHESLRSSIAELNIAWRELDEAERIEYLKKSARGIESHNGCGIDCPLPGEWPDIEREQAESR